MSYLPSEETECRGGNTQSRRQRSKQREYRFHGAFTGGFSAGYFNTVGTKEGWTPSRNMKRQQQLEDFMDDEDHASWGGPTTLNNISKMKDPSTLEISHQAVGPRLLRHLGWRDWGSDVIPENAINNSEAIGTTTELLVENDDTSKKLLKVHFSRRKLNKVKVRSGLSELTYQKFDHCGLGFEPYRDTAELQQCKEGHEQQSQDRASHNTRLSFYGISEYTYAELNKRIPDDGGPKKRMNPGNHYNSEVYEYKSDSEDEHEHDAYPISSSWIPDSGVDINKYIKFEKKKTKSVDVDAIFASWASVLSPGGKKAQSKVPRFVPTSDRRPPPVGFVLVDYIIENERRYFGPKLPFDCRVRRHEFGDHESPHVSEVLSKANRVDHEKDWRGKRIQQQSTQRNAKSKSDELFVRSCKNFSCLTEAIKSRFTIGLGERWEKNKFTSEISTTIPSGLHMPNQLKTKHGWSKKISSAKPNNAVQKVTVSRTEESFFPIPLLCKRFCVPEMVISGNVLRRYREKKQLPDYVEEIMIGKVPSNENTKSINRPSVAYLRMIFQACSDESSYNKGDDCHEGTDKAEVDLTLLPRDSRSYFKEGNRPQASTCHNTRTERRSCDDYSEKAGFQFSEAEWKDPCSRICRAYDESSSAMAVLPLKRKNEKRCRKYHYYRKRHKRDPF